MESDAILTPFSRLRTALAPAWVFWLTLGAIALGAALRLYQFFADPSLWLDELAVANNLAEQSLIGLLREPLSYSQVAPPGFLLIEKLLYDLFGASDRMLRLYSLVAGIGALGAAALVGLRLKLGRGVWIAPFVLALSPAFIFQSAQVKPYSSDVFIALGLVALALRLIEEGNAKRTIPVVLGALAPWFSFPAAFTLGGTGIMLLFSDQRRRLFPVVAIWGVATVAALVYGSALVHPDTARMMQVYWGRENAGFPPGLAGLLPWLVEQFGALLWSGIGLRAVKVWLGIALVACVVLWRRNRMTLGVITLPIVLAVLAATLRRYPLGDRTSHWLAALLVVLIAVAVTAGMEALARPLPRLAPALSLLVVAPMVLTITQNRPPYYIDHATPVLTGIARERQEGDRLYVYPGAWHVYRYYGDLAGIPRERVSLGRCPRRSMQETLREIDSLRGNPRVWFLFAHVVSPRRRELILQYLDTIGVKRRTITYPEPYAEGSDAVDAHLYDLSDSPKLRNSSWEVYPVPPPLPNEQSQCMLGMVPME